MRCRRFVRAASAWELKLFDCAVHANRRFVRAAGAQEFTKAHANGKAEVSETGRSANRRPRQTVGKKTKGRFMSINDVNLTGRLAQDARLSDTAAGKPCARFTVAVSERTRVDQTGQWHDRPCYFDCVMFGNRAAALVPYLRQGSKVSLHGRLSQRRWEQDGKRMSKVNVVVDDVELMTMAHGGLPSDALADEDFVF